MRLLVIAATITTVVATPVQAQDNDIPFREIFSALATKVDRASDQPFFETVVLQGRAVRETSDYVGNFQYSYGGALSGKGSLYSETTTASGTHVSFHASDFGDAGLTTCLRFREAEETVRREGWTMKPPLPVPPVGGEEIGTSYDRGGVVFKISNFDPILDGIEPWNSEEEQRALIDEAHAHARKREAIKPGTKAFDDLCVTSIDVDFTR